MMPPTLDRNAGFHPHRPPSSPGGAWAKTRANGSLTPATRLHHGDFYRLLAPGSAVTQKNALGISQVKVPNTTSAIAETP
jgi:hypothetical protein